MIVVANLPETEETKANDSFKIERFKYSLKRHIQKIRIKRNVQKFLDIMSRASSVASDVE